ncbi:hypothetical protein WJX73_006284 [Symbiochloris irregularis]|uniref:Uncharacterized protein n=1 Tax=Symbiochloris irregularis TaxID=706552 RepID=A0AAW1PRR9_9CHLO
MADGSAGKVPAGATPRISRKQPRSLFARLKRRVYVLWFQWSIVNGAYICTWQESVLINLTVLFIVLLVLFAAWKQTAYLVGFLSHLAHRAADDHSLSFDSS